MNKLSHNMDKTASNLESKNNGHADSNIDSLIEPNINIETIINSHPNSQIEKRLKTSQLKAIK